MTVTEQRLKPVPQSGWKPFVVSPPRSWKLEIAMIGALAVCTFLASWHSPLIDFDIWIRDLTDANRPGWAETITVYTNKLGQGGPVSALTLAVAAIIAYRKRTVRPVIAFITLYAMAGFVLLLKLVFPRIYPHWPRPEPGPLADAQQSLLFAADRSDFGALGQEASGAYPSGHVVNTIVWYGLLVLLIGAVLKTWQRRLILLIPPVVVFFSTTYLGHHWFTDSAAGVFIGVLILRFMRRIPWETVQLPGWLEPEKRYL